MPLDLKLKNTLKRMPSWGTHLMALLVGLSLSIEKQNLPKSNWVGLMFSLEGAQLRSVTNKVDQQVYLVDRKKNCLLTADPVLVAKIDGTISLVFPKEQLTIPLLEKLVKRKALIVGMNKQTQACRPRSRQVSYG